MPIHTDTTSTHSPNYNPAHATTTAHTPAEDFRTVLLNRVSTSAVVAGVAMALAVHIIINLLGIGIGVIANPAMETADQTALSVAAVTWWAVGGIISAFAGGFTAGRLAGEPSESTAGWHGLSAWAMSILVVAVLMTTAAGALVGGNFNVMADLTREPAAVTASGTASDTAAYDVTADPVLSRETNLTEAEGDAIGLAALLSALALVIGALVAWVGGRMGAVAPLRTERHVSPRNPLH